ncbi:DUF3857 domain-containing transglutaminase family protein [Ferruginibacter sp. SUN002]|uniref:DUF3857 domain-containing transglutaminase family protein n=1 Tax=Ferruginibacter sp. SUN002 TaxID=2937789 RepID=UPI003D36F668
MIFRTTILILVFFSQALKSQAQKNNYSICLVTAGLLKNANAIKRFEEVKLVIDDIGKATLYHKYAITILNEAADHYAGVYEYYDKLRNVKYIEGELFDAFGERIRKLKKSDIQDISLAGGSSFVSDSRIKYYNFQNKNYPYTIQYETAIDFKGIFYFPDWMPVQGSNLSVELSKLIVETPVDYGLRYKMFNISKEPTITKNKNNNVYEWQIEKFSAVSKEILSQEWYELTPTVFLAPTDFDVEDYKGNMSTWSGFGKFVYSLNVGRDQLPEATKNMVHQLTDSIHDDREKIRTLYKYLQNNTRYVNIKLGIGGWQTFPAEYVAQKGYGDCKALSNYMCAMLKEVGLKAFYTLIKSGDDDKKLLVDFPSTQFNHIIVCVPLQKDSVWLECTSQTLPMGYLSSFTADRYALLVDENGGKIVRTPKYDIDDNIQVRKINAVLEETGDLNTKVKTTYAAMQQDNLHSVINNLSKASVTEYLKEVIMLPSFDIINYSFKEQAGKLPVVYEDLEIKARNYAQVSGKRLFISPNVLSKTKRRLSTDTARINSVELNFEYHDMDSVIIDFPAGYQVESLPGITKIENKFGKYYASFVVKSNQIIYYRNREQFSGNFPAADYSELAKFYADIYKADRLLVVLKKSE